MTEQTPPEQTTSKQTLWVYGLVGVLVVAILAVAIYILLDQIAPSNTTTDDTVNLLSQQNDYDGVDIIEPPRSMPDFTLTSQTGEPISLSDLHGQPTLLFFGFTNCPDVCPLTVNDLKQVRDALGTQGEAVNYVFISVDGYRDTPETLRQFFEARQTPDFIGLTGDEADIRRIGADYGLFFQYGTENPATAAANGTYYNIDHTSYVFLLDENGQWIRRYVFGIDRNLIVDDLQTLLNQQA